MQYNNTLKERNDKQVSTRGAIGDVVRVIKSGPNVTRCLADFFKQFQCPVEEASINSLREAVDDPLLDQDKKDKASKELHRYRFGNRKYLNRLQDISDGHTTFLEVDMGDVYDWMQLVIDDPTSVDDAASKLSELQDSLHYHVERSVRLATIAAEDVRREMCPTRDSEPGISMNRTILMSSDLPVWHRAPFELVFTPASNMQVSGIRDIQEFAYGRWMRIEVLISKVCSARPMMKIAKYTCNRCQADAYQPVDYIDYVPSRTCLSESCKNAGDPGDLTLVPKESRMLPYETVIVQEPSTQCPQGCVPRRMEIIVEGHLANILKPGMQVTVSGVAYPIEKKGFMAIATGLTREMTFKVHHISIHKQAENLNMQERVLLNTMIASQMSKPGFYDYVANSICPTIFGMLDVKKALLLQLVGAPNLKTNAGLNVRGEIHVLLMGDPGVAKSQLLVKIVKVAPRSTYTTGKGASGVGLTASVVKDPVTGEFSLEGGSIVLADTGICCIDEFDKMDEQDRTAIHEVMEQQTVSIAKAGLNVQLNARTAILAAANPVFGRYDLSKSAVENMKLPYSLISRFDLQFLLLDNVDNDNDRALSMHILNVHRGTSRLHVENYLSQTELRYFILQAQKFNPLISDAVATEIREKYVDIRAAERLQRQMAGKENTYTTPRALFSIIRLAQAHARIRFSNEVSMEDVEEAVRLMEASKASIQVADQASNKNIKPDNMAEIIDLIRRMDSTKSNREDTEYDGYLEIGEIEAALATNGYSRKQLDETLAQYIYLGIMQFRNNRNRDVGFTDKINP